MIPRKVNFLVQLFSLVVLILQASLVPVPVLSFGQFNNRRTFSSRTNNNLQVEQPIQSWQYYTYSRTRTRSTVTNLKTSLLPAEIVQFQNDLESIRQLPRIRESSNGSNSKGGGKGEDPLLALALSRPDTPTFRRLFTHETWRQHLGGPFHKRWWKCVATVNHSEILRSIYKSVLVMSMYGYLVSWALPRWVSSNALGGGGGVQQLPLSLAANALGLLLVFRTNNAYNRLDEARSLWSHVLYLAREMVATVVAAWDRPSCWKTRKINSHSINNALDSSQQPNGGSSASMTNKLSSSRRNGTTKGLSTRTVVTTCRYLAAFVWSLRDMLRDGDERRDMLDLLLEDSVESDWVARQRSRPLAIHGQLRRFLYEQMMQGHLRENVYYFLETDLKDLARVVASCERLFESPIPPTMSRHGLRSTTLFFLTMPVVLATSMSPLLSMAWTAIIAFIYLGIDELGVQVEQPFQMIPLWQLCHVVLSDMEELVLHPLDEVVQDTNTASALQQQQNKDEKKKAV